MHVTQQMIEAARRAEFDFYQRGRAIGAGRFIATPDAVIRAMLEGALAAIRDPADRPAASDPAGSRPPKIVTAMRPKRRR